MRAWWERWRAPVLEAAVPLVVVIALARLGRARGWTGTPGDDAATALWPFYLSTWDHRVILSSRTWFAVVAAGLAYIPLRPWLRRLGDARVTLMALAGAAWLYHLGLALVRDDVERALRVVFDRGVEYWKDSDKVDASFLAGFPDAVGKLSLHGGTHPPGPILLLFGMRWGGFTSPHDAELLCSFTGVAAALALWGAARRLADEDVARDAVVMFLFAGSIALFAIASMDMFTMLFGALALYGFARALDGDAWGGVVWGAALAAASLFNLIAGLLCVTYAILLFSRRRGLDRRRKTALALGPATFVASYLVLVGVWHYRPLHVVAVLLHHFRDMRYEHERSLGRALLGNPVAFLCALGLPLAGLVARAAFSTARAAMQRKMSDTTTLVAAALLPPALGILAGIPRAEVEHVYLLFVPMVALAAATASRRMFPRDERWLPRLLVPALVAQAILVETWYDTLW